MVWLTHQRYLKNNKDMTSEKGEEYQKVSSQRSKAAEMSVCSTYTHKAKCLKHPKREREFDGDLRIDLPI